jgi:hypothetical protein
MLLSVGRNLTLPPDFDKRVGTGHASMQIQEIVVADHEGRVSHLYFQEEANRACSLL